MNLKTVFIAAGGYIGFFLGGFDGLLNTLVIFVIIDYTTGVMCACLDKKLSSKVGARGIFKKVTIFLIIGIAHHIGLYSFNNDETLRNAVIFFYISNEGLSMIENLTKLGLPIPEKLKITLAILKSKGGENNNEN